MEKKLTQREMAESFATIVDGFEGPWFKYDNYPEPAISFTRENWDKAMAVFLDEFDRLSGKAVGLRRSIIRLRKKAGIVGEPVGDHYRELVGSREGLLKAAQAKMLAYDEVDSVVAGLKSHWDGLVAVYSTALRQLGSTVNQLQRDYRRIKPRESTGAGH